KIRRRRMFPRLSDRSWRTFIGSAIVLVCLSVMLRPVTTTGEDPKPKDPVQLNADAMVTTGRQTFRFDTFGDEAFWGGMLRLNEAVASALSPKMAPGLGLKVDVDALPEQLVQKLRKGDVDVNSPATTLALLRLNAVVGLTGFFSGSQLTSI